MSDVSSSLFSGGLSGLLDDVRAESIRLIPVSDIYPDPNQPRQTLTKNSIKEMAASLEAEGQLELIMVREHPDLPGKYMLVFGERRWRGAQIAEIAEMKCRVNELTDNQCLRYQLIENLQRENMSPMDIARGIERLVKQEGSARKAANAIGISESRISKYLACIDLPPVTDELATLNISKDVETLSALARIEKQDTEAARELADEAKKTGKLNRKDVRESAKKVNASTPGKSPSKPKAKTQDDSDEDSSAMEYAGFQSDSTSSSLQDEFFGMGGLDLSDVVSEGASAPPDAQEPEESRSVPEPSLPLPVYGAHSDSTSSNVALDASAVDEGLIRASLSNQNEGITQVAELQISEFLSKAANAADNEQREMYRCWAYGVYLFWDRLSIGWRNTGEGERMESLAAGEGV